MTQPDNIILSIIHKWASILWKPGIDYDELVAIGYCATKPLPANKPKERVASWAKWMMLKFIYGDSKRKGFQKDNPKTIANALNIKELVSYPEDDAIIDIKEAITNLSETEAQLIYMRFWRNMTYEEIGRYYNRTWFWAKHNCDRVLGLLKTRLLD